MAGRQPHEEGGHSLEEVFQVDAYVASYKVDTVEGHARRLFVQKVYSVLAIAVVITLFSGLLGLFLGQQLGANRSGGSHVGLEQFQRGELINIIVAISLCVTFLNWCAASYLGLRLQTDLTGWLLACWAAQLVWYFLLIGLWLFASSWRWAMVSGATLGLLISLLQLAIHTQMIGGGGGDLVAGFGGGGAHPTGGNFQQQKVKTKRKFTFTSSQLLLATVSLYLDSLLLFTLLTPITGAVVSLLQAVTASADLPKDGVLRDA